MHVQSQKRAPSGDAPVFNGAAARFKSVNWRYLRSIGARASGIEWDTFKALDKTGDAPRQNQTERAENGRIGSP